MTHVSDADYNGIYAYIHCVDCLQENQHMSPREYARLSVGVSPVGDLIIWCDRHDRIISRMENHKISDILMEAACTPCACGNHKKETRN